MPEGWPTNCGNPRQTDCPPGHAKGDLGWMPQYAYPAVRDAKAAVRWVRQNAARFDVDPDYITAFGGSAGATSVMALALLDEPDYKDEIAVTDDPTLATTNLAQPSSVATVIDHWGSDWMARQLWERGSGGDRYNATANPPLAIFHGTVDNIVPFRNETDRIIGGYNRTGV